jgi:hypothetical protein
MDSSYRTSCRGGILAATLMLALAACSSDDGPAPPCPEVVSPRDAARIVAFSGNGRDLTDVRFETRIDGAALACEYDEDDGKQVVEAELQIAFTAEKGPASKKGTAEFTYFVAIADNQRNIVAREEFPITVSLEGNQTRGRFIETVSPTIPLKEGETGASYRVYVGFALNKEQLEYNRRNPV